MQGNKITLGKRNLAILNGDDDLSQWDDEELMRGQRKAKNGRWTGRKPTVVPLAVHNELTRRRMSQAYDLLRDNLVGAVEVLSEIVNDTEAENKDRIKAAELIIDRVMGKAPQKVDIQMRTRLQEVQERVTRVEVVWDHDDVVDAEVVEG